MKVQNVTIGEFQTFRSWGCYIDGRVVIGEAEPKYNYIEVPGMDGVLDATEALDGFVHYNARTINIPLHKICKDTEEMRLLYSRIQNDIHGKHNKIILSDDPKYYWEGRLSVGNPEYNGSVFSVEIEGTVSPYKREIDPIISEDWMWDPFDFENDVIQEITNISVSGEKDILVYGNNMPYVPDIKLVGNENVILNFNGETYTIKPGTQKILNIIVKSGINIFSFKGNGVVSISYEGGSL